MWMVYTHTLSLSPLHLESKFSVFNNSLRDVELINHPHVTRETPTLKSYSKALRKSIFFLVSKATASVTTCPYKKTAVFVGQVVLFIFCLQEMTSVHRNTTTRNLATLGQFLLDVDPGRDISRLFFFRTCFSDTLHTKKNKKQKSLQSHLQFLQLVRLIKFRRKCLG